MSIPMPEHWAERIAEGTGVDFWWHNGTKGIRVGEKLITTTQAEAYADARVREALEDAASMADDVFAFSVGDSIRALIPQQ